MDYNELLQKHMEDQQKTAVELEKHEQQIDSLKRRVGKIEDSTKNIERLATSVENMCKELKLHNERLEQLERQPADKWNNLTDTLIKVFASGVAGYILAHFF